jgi:7-cyano-7-deazaguanine synthase
MDNAVVILSGGQDSTICLHWAIKKYKKVYAVSFDYGQKHKIELMSAIEICRQTNIEHEIIKTQQILKSTSPLTDNTKELEEYDNYEEMDDIIGDRIELTFVPMRNALFLTIGANFALSKNCRTLITGVCQQDNANYPDCRQNFIDAQQETINKALGIDDFKIEAPLMNLSKAESIKLAIELDNECMNSLAYSHTCYAGEYPPCGKCHSCVLRAQGFKEAGVEDPLIVRAKKEGLM